MTGAELQVKSPMSRVVPDSGVEAESSSVPGMSLSSSSGASLCRRTPSLLPHLARTRAVRKTASTVDSSSKLRSASSSKLLYLFSGKYGLPGGFDERVALRGGSVEFMDLEVSAEHDLCDDFVFETVLRRIANGDFDNGVMMSPPCSTFSRALSVPLRGSTPPELYGRKDLVGKDKEKARIGTLCALRCVRAVKAIEARSSKAGRIP